ncbi:DUF305 domain-containing protein [Nocardioides sp.]|uniref:DUF305 domain-containing protein n=1 Tax=Nocardioides sp. TaxID=35761 RepID=UPI002C08206B|nr:DUF305 domain-containing protein [Nocardioides sp.]HSX67479.1 DUF305 domain-containing protein [Nocardioides sp.]
MSVRRVASAVLTVAVAFGLGACGEEEKAPLPRETAANGTVFNSADATFANDLLVQRAREFALIDLTLERPLDTELTAFVDGARAVRAAEIEQVTTWLTDWDKEVPATIRDHAAAHAGGHHFEEIESATDAEFAEVWVAAYREELEASGDIAAAEAAEGVFSGAKTLAADVEDTNESEMQQLAQLSG